MVHPGLEGDFARTYGDADAPLQAGRTSLGSTARALTEIDLDRWLRSGYERQGAMFAGDRSMGLLFAFIIIGLPSVAAVYDLYHEKLW